MTRGGRTKSRDQGERRCIVTGETGPRRGLVRFVIGPGDAVVPDVAEKLPGRGMWVSASRGAIESAVRKNLFARAARRPVKAADGLAGLVEDLLARRLIEHISLARKAGQAVAGLENTKASLKDGSAVLLLQAADGSRREKARLRPPKGPESLVESLSAKELGLAFGRQNVIHAALKSGGAADRVKHESLRLSGFRADSGE